LRGALAARLRDTGMTVAADDLVLTQGASEGIALALRLFAVPGDAVAVEEPTYHNVLAALAALGLRAAPVPIRDGAPDLVALERTLERSDVKVFYTMPTFHNPLGTSTGLAHRRALLAAAAKAGKPVIEDAYEMDLRFTGPGRAPARRARRARPRRAALLVLEVALPGRARRIDRCARPRVRRAAPAQARDRSRRLARAAGRAGGLRDERRL
jgi:DNA-binding transcriptional MocR family regulator